MQSTEEVLKIWNEMVDKEVGVTRGRDALNGIFIGLMSSRDEEYKEAIRKKMDMACGEGHKFERYKLKTEIQKIIRNISWNEDDEHSHCLNVKHDICCVIELQENLQRFFNPEDEKNPMHFCLNGCGVYLGHRGFCSDKCHNECYNSEVKNHA